MGHSTPTAHSRARNTSYYALLEVYSRIRGWWNAVRTCCFELMAREVKVMAGGKEG